MTYYQRIVVLMALSFSAALSAHADDKGTSGRWTKDDVATLCHSRFGADDRSHGYLACIERNKGKIGRDETPAEMQELDANKATDN